MNINCVKIGGRSFNTINKNFLIRFNNTREISPSVIQVIIVLLTTSAIIVSAEGVHFKGQLSLVLSDF